MSIEQALAELTTALKENTAESTKSSRPRCEISSENAAFHRKVIGNREADRGWLQDARLDLQNFDMDLNDDRPAHAEGRIIGAILLQAEKEWDYLDGESHKRLEHFVFTWLMCLTFEEQCPCSRRPETLGPTQSASSTKAPSNWAPAESAP